MKKANEGERSSPSGSDPSVTEHDANWQLSPRRSLQLVQHVIFYSFASDTIKRIPRLFVFFSLWPYSLRSRAQEPRATSNHTAFPTAIFFYYYYLSCLHEQKKKLNQTKPNRNIDGRLNLRIHFPIGLVLRFHAHHVRTVFGLQSDCTTSLPVSALPVAAGRIRNRSDEKSSNIDSLDSRCIAAASRLGRSALQSDRSLIFFLTSVLVPH